MLKQLRRQDRRISPASRAATINRANQIVAKVLENTRREFGGAGWPGHSVVDIVVLGPSRGGSAAAVKKTFSKTYYRVNEYKNPVTFPR
jgi:hypothetical protein